MTILFDYLIKLTLKYISNKTTLLPKEDRIDFLTKLQKELNKYKKQLKNLENYEDNY